MSSIFTCVFVLVLYSLMKAPTPTFERFSQKIEPARIALAVVFFGYPVWGMAGVMLGLLCKISSEKIPGSGLGSPNLVFTLAVIIGTVVLSMVPFLQFQQAKKGILIIAIAFVGVFGWFLPFFATQ